MIFSSIELVLTYNTGMHVYEVWVKTPRYHGKTPLTYTHTQKLTPGTVVSVSLRSQMVLGVIHRSVTPPKNITLKPIETIHKTAGTLPPKHLQLIKWMISYYAIASGPLLQLFLPNSLPKKALSSITSARNKLHDPPTLTKEQKQAFQTIKNNNTTSILHGITGSGKTRVYIELIATTLNKGKSATFLVPEIGLVPHVLNELEKFFPRHLIIEYHSGLTEVVRRNAWLRAANETGPLIIVGARSSLFLPVQNTGIIIIDEFHDEGYRQTNAPKYHAVRVASRLSQLNNARLILGSATPPIADLFVANQKNIPVIPMQSLARRKEQKTTVSIIDKRDRSEFTRSDSISTSLLHAIEDQLKKEQQSLIFINRRGSARVVACRQCGWRSLCPLCDLPLILHEDTFTLRCHTCGFTTKPVSSCPTCNNSEIIYSSPGTKGIEKEIKKMLPNAMVARFDGDNLTDERIDKKFADINSGKVDILIGTQVLVKGFDLPRLGLVGIIDADSNLSMPDFSTEERTYQLIRQATGRVNRGHIPGTVIIQSLHPNSPLITQAASKNWPEFYASQIEARRDHKFPPFVFLLKLQCTRKKRDAALAAAQHLKNTLAHDYPNVQILGPAPASKEKAFSSYTWQIVVKSKDRSRLVRIVEELPSGWKYDLDPSHLL